MRETACESQIHECAVWAERGFTAIPREFYTNHWASFVTPIDASKLIEEKLAEASGKPVLVHCDPDFSGHASIKIASDDSPAHLLRYKPEFESELPYLSAFQCGMALRSIQAKTVNRFDLAPAPAMVQEVRRLIEDHIRRTGSTVPLSVVPELSQQLGHGLGLQLRSMPIAIRVDEWLYRDFPALADLQRRSIERQLQEAMHALGPSVRAFAPQRIIDANVGMSCAFAKFWAAIWNEPEIAAPFTSAGYGKIGDELLRLVQTLDRSSDGDRELVNQWSERLGLTGWFQTIDKQ